MLYKEHKLDELGPRNILQEKMEARALKSDSITMAIGNSLIGEQKSINYAGDINKMELGNRRAVCKKILKKVQKQKELAGIANDQPLLS